MIGEVIIWCCLGPNIESLKISVLRIEMVWIIFTVDYLLNFSLVFDFAHADWMMMRWNVSIIVMIRVIISQV
jgi:hypothetical protein